MDNKGLKTPQEAVLAEEILQKLKLLGKIRNKVEKGLTTGVVEENRQLQREKLMELLSELKDLILDDEVEKVGPFEPLEAKPLSADLYVLPEEMNEEHRQIVQQFRENKSIKSWSYAGTLLSGRPGTGKTEYVRYLAGMIADQAEFVVADQSAIVNSAKPGLVLTQLYKNLQKKAEETGKYQVILFDEVEFLINAAVKKSSVTNASRGGERYTEFSDTHTFELDARGEEIIAVFKTILSGTGIFDRVYTICTSNISTFQAALLRGGRLKLNRFYEYRSNLAREEDVCEVEGMALLPVKFDLAKATARRLESKHYEEILGRMMIESLEYWGNTGPDPQEVKKLAELQRAKDGKKDKFLFNNPEQEISQRLRKEKLQKYLELYLPEIKLIEGDKSADRLLHLSRSMNRSKLATRVNELITKGVNEEEFRRAFFREILVEIFDHKFIEMLDSAKLAHQVKIVGGNPSKSIKAKKL